MAMTQPVDPLGPSNSEFLEHLQRQPGTSLWVTSFYGNPDKTPGENWRGMPYHDGMASLVDSWTRPNTYFSVAALKPDADGELARKRNNFARLVVLVADDVDIQDLMGNVSYVIETSPGKCQAGIFIDGDDPDAANELLVRELVTEFAKRGYVKADISGNNSVRYVRLPVGTNSKPRPTGNWAHTVSQWNPEVVLTLADAAAVFNINLEQLAPEAAKSNVIEGKFGQQGENMGQWVANVIQGEGLHDSINQIAASLVATGMPGGAVVNTLRSLMDNSSAARDDRFRSRYDDIPRAVSTAEQKYARGIDPTPLPHTLQSADLPGYSVGEISGLMEPVEYLIKGVMNRGDMSVTFGDSGTMKSFVELDKAMRLGMGWEWCGHKVKRSSTLIILGEGAGGFKKRIRAWLQHHNLLHSDDKPWVWVVDRGAELYNNPEQIHQWLKQAKEKLGRPIDHILVDTLNTNMGAGADENDASAIGTMLANAHAAAPDCAISFVHHVGHGDKTRERGSYAIRGNMDNRTLITRDGNGLGRVITVESLKVKDGENYKSINLTYEVVVIGKDLDGDDVTSLVVVPTDMEPAIGGSTKAGGASKRAQLIMSMLMAQPDHRMNKFDLRTAYKEKNPADGSNFAKGLKELEQLDLIADSKPFGMVIVKEAL